MARRLRSLSKPQAQKPLGDCRQVAVSLVVHGLNRARRDEGRKRVRRYRSLSSTVRGNADRAMRAASVTPVELKDASDPSPSVVPSRSIGISGCRQHAWSRP